MNNAYRKSDLNFVVLCKLQFNTAVLFDTVIKLYEYKMDRIRHIAKRVVTFTEIDQTL